MKHMPQGRRLRTGRRGQQLEGNENSAAGLNDQSKSVQHQHQHQQHQQQEPTIPTPTPTASVLSVAKHVVCNFTLTIADCPTADLFNITVTTNNGSSISFNGSESGTPLTINPPFSVTYQVTETNAEQGFTINTIPVGLGPIDIAFNPDNGFLYVANQIGNNVSVIDPVTNTVVGIPIAVGSSPFDIAFNEDNGFLYVANGGENIVSVIAPLTTTFSEGCNSTIGSAGQTATCTVTNTYGRP